MDESKNLEFKEQITNSFLKTVSAFANYGGGDIIFGVDDNGKRVGLDDPRQARLNIESKINDSIKPRPVYTMYVDPKDRTVTLHVEDGTKKPYLYKAKAYQRNDTADVEVDHLELKRLVLKGENLSFEELPADNQDLTFSVLSQKFSDQLQIQVNQNVLKTLSLYTEKEGYNNAAALLADHNNFPGIDMARFGENINVFRGRNVYEHMSLISQIDNALAVYRYNYQIEIINGAFREKHELIPETAFREAVVNAEIHRQWDVGADVKVSMWDDHIEIVSPGGLPEGIREEDFLAGSISIPRNPILAYIFMRLGVIERFGTGVKRIREAYIDSTTKPEFKISDQSVTVILPVILQGDAFESLSQDEEIVFNVIKNGSAFSRAEISEMSGFGKSKTIRLLNRLIDKGYVEKIGTGRSSKYVGIR